LKRERFFADEFADEARRCRNVSLRVRIHRRRWVLDLAVDAGVTEAAKELQEVVGARADSSIGPATVAATKAMPPREVVKRLTERRAKIGKGQTDRIDAVAKAAIEMTDAAIAAI